MKKFTRQFRGGFTLVELCLAMIVSAIIASALATFTLAMSQCWRQTEKTQTASISSNQLAQRILSRVQDAKRIGAWRDGTGMNPAAFIYWRSDDDSDGAIETGELGAIAYDPTSHAIVAYLPISAGGDQWSTDDLIDPNAITRFTGGLTATPIITNVAGAILRIDTPASTSISPTLVWTVQLSQADGTTETETITLTLRTGTLQQ